VLEESLWDGKNCQSIHKIKIVLRFLKFLGLLKFEHSNLLKKVDYTGSPLFLHLLEVFISIPCVGDYFFLLRPRSILGSAGNMANVATLQLWLVF
jgi:hypothetical protein